MHSRSASINVLKSGAPGSFVLSVLEKDYGWRKDFTCRLKRIGDKWGRSVRARAFYLFSGSRFVQRSPRVRFVPGDKEMGRATQSVRSITSWETQGVIVTFLGFFFLDKLRVLERTVFELVLPLWWTSRPSCARREDNWSFTIIKTYTSAYIYHLDWIYTHTYTVHVYLSKVWGR